MSLRQINYKERKLKEILIFSELVTLCVNLSPKQSFITHRSFHFILRQTVLEKSLNSFLLIARTTNYSARQNYDLKICNVISEV